MGSPSSLRWYSCFKTVAIFRNVQFAYKILLELVDSLNLLDRNALSVPASTHLRVPENN
jgi:hypothetical protein